MTYWLPDGRRFVLLTHTPAEWADVAAAQLRRVGCSEEYAARYAALVAAATTEPPEPAA